MNIGVARRAALTVAAGMLVAIPAGCGGPHTSASTSPSSTTSSIPPPTTSPQQTTVASTTSPTAPSTSTTTVPATTTTLAPLQIKGTVSDSEGRPVPGAALIDAGSLQVFHADGAGQFTIPYCSTLDQFWVADWTIPLGTNYRTAFGRPGSAGGSTTYFAPPPTTPGPGYGRLDRLWPQSASDPSPCHGEPVAVRLPAGGGVDITWTTKPMSGTPHPVSGPVNGYYQILPGLPYYTGTYTPSANSNGLQIMQQLGAGGLAINSATVRFSCQGGGVQATSRSSWQVPIVAGQTAQVTCTLP